MLVRCRACRGSKMVSKIGCLMEECKMCDGIGWVTVAEAIKPVIETPEFNHVLNAHIADMEEKDMLTAKEESKISDELIEQKIAEITKQKDVKKGDERHR